MQSTLVFKFGGSSLATPDHIKNAANHIKEYYDKGHKIIVVVSAMGTTTNDLISLSKKVSSTPSRRELDMLISTGERVSMSLFSMALKDLNVSSISFTGSQAGILTTDSHSNARIIDIKPFRVEEELNKNKVIVLAGFQGVNPDTKEITTLGRGGTDTTAIAMATHFKAEKCILMKDVEGIMTADPKLIPQAQIIDELSLCHLAEMTHWGAKVLHSRAVSLALKNSIQIEICSFKSFASKTHITQEKKMYESITPLSINKHDEVLTISTTSQNLPQAISQFNQDIANNDISSPVILAATQDEEHCRWMACSSAENTEFIKSFIQGSNSYELLSEGLASCTVTYNLTPGQSEVTSLMNKMSENNIKVDKYLSSEHSISLFVDRAALENTVKSIHSLL